MSLATGLHARILAVLEGSAAPREVRELVLLCQALALACLARKNSSNVLSRLQGLDRDDLAYDCVADLFRNDGQGQFPELRTYFTGYCVDTLTDEQVLFHLQRLVSSKTHQGVVRLFSEADPTLARILRNIKGAVHSLKSFTEVERFGEPYLVPALCDALEHAPSFDGPTLEQSLLPLIDGDEFIPEALAKVARFLRGQEQRSRLIPLMALARTLRSVYERKNSPRLGPPSAGIDEAALDREALIEDACMNVRSGALEGYVRNGKIPAELLEVYLDVVREGLRHRLIESNGTEYTLFESLARRLPALSEEEYRRNHKNKLEYISRLTSSLVAGSLRRA